MTGSKSSSGAGDGTIGAVRWGRWLLAAAMVTLVVALGISAVSVLSQPVAPVPVDRAFTRVMIEHLQDVESPVAAGVRVAAGLELRQMGLVLDTAATTESAELEAANLRLARLGIGRGAEAGFPTGDELVGERASGGDRRRIDDLIASHRATIEIARVQLERGTDGALRGAARRILALRGAQIRTAERLRRRGSGD